MLLAMAVPSILVAVIALWVLEKDLFCGVRESGSDVLIEVGVRNKFRPRDILVGTLRDEAEPLELCRLLRVNRS
jgi:hypothetical protein